ncbi:MAG: hypothetical protein QM734_01180 [Cyclobacteriaceae bacterium]
MLRYFLPQKFLSSTLLEIGDNSTISWDIKVYNLGFSQIGSNTMISQSSHLCGGTHDFRSKDFELIRTGFTIGNKVWIAADAFVGPGIKNKMMVLLLELAQ